MSAADKPAYQPLLDDGVLAVSLEPRTLPWVERWLPRFRREPRAAQPRAFIDVIATQSNLPAPAGPPIMEMHGVAGWMIPSGARFAAANGGVGAEVDLERCHATVHVRTDSDPPAIVQVVSALTMVTGLLFARLSRALVHAAAVVPPGATGAWLLAGGSFSGKTTTTATLLQAGWAWLSDDDVVLGPAPHGGVHAVGWPRRFDLDHGFGTGTPHGVRSRVGPEQLGPGPWRSAAPLTGLLFPRVDAERPTQITPVHPADALSRLVRHAPWLLADPAGAGPVLMVLERAARLPVFELRLGADSFCNAEMLQFALHRAFAAQIHAKHGLET